MENPIRSIISSKPAFSLLLLFLFTTSVYAATLEISAAVDPSGRSDIIVNADLPNARGTAFSISITGDTDSVLVKDRSGLELAHTVQKIGDKTVISAIVPSDYLTFSIASNSLTMKNASEWTYDLGIGTSENMSLVVASLKLPVGSTLKSTTGAVEGSGDTLQILWRSNGLDTEHRARMKASYETRTASGEGNLGAILPYVAGIILFIIVFGIVFWRWRHHKSPKKQEAHGTETKKPEAEITNPSPPASTQTGPATTQPAAPILIQASPQPPPMIQASEEQAHPQLLLTSHLDKVEAHPVFKTLDEGEKQIIREIAKADGTTTQAQLNLNLHMPKVTLSRKLASLENRGIVIKTQKGIRNLVSLSEIFGK